MLRTSRLLGAATLAMACGLFPVTAAHADTPVNSEEWWFHDWDIQGKVWPISRGQGVTVAVVDSGVNASLPDLAGVVLPGRNYQAGGGDGRTDVDDEPGSKGHGTSMAITIAGHGGRNDWLGIAPDVKVLPIVVEPGSQDFPKAITYAVDSGAKVINVSQGESSSTFPNRCPDDVQRAMAYAADHDVVVVASAGNSGDRDNQPEYPGSCAGVLAAGAVGPNLAPWSGTQRQPYVAVSAPGYKVGLIGRDGVLYHDSWGTSIASAFTSAEAALIRAKFPHLNARQVVQRIIATAMPTHNPGQQDPAMGYGIIRPYRSLVGDVPANAPNPVYDALDKWKAAQQASAAPSAPVNNFSHHSASSSMSPRTRTLLAASLVLGFLVIVGVVILLVRKNRKRTPAQPYSGPPSGPPFGGAPLGPPPGAS